MPVEMLDAPSGCEGCKGACCREWIIDVTREEANALGPELTEEGGLMAPCMRHDPDTRACVALDPETGACTIYEHRPQVCRDFQLGSYSCDKARRTHDR